MKSKCIHTPQCAEYDLCKYKAGDYYYTNGVHSLHLHADERGVIQITVEAMSSMLNELGWYGD